MSARISEFGLIQRYFTRATPNAALGVGDDAALLDVGPGMELAVSTDMLLSGTHFFPDADPFMLGHKVLAVNLSDMAAMGAKPRWALLAVALPQADEAWLQRFSGGFFALAQRYGVELVGGDTTRGPLSLSITILGEVPKGVALRRSGAQPGDDIWVSGQLGDAALALAHLKGHIQLPEADFAPCAQRLHRPEPRIELGQALCGLATSAIDISDGLLADLGHILECSKTGAAIQLEALPLSPAMREMLGQPLGRHCALAGGDDYELCFTAPSGRRNAIEKITATLGLPLTRIGSIETGSGCMVRDSKGNIIQTGESGFDHFA
jgi:thiamine-monophosphate kinase